MKDIPKCRTLIARFCKQNKRCNTISAAVDLFLNNGGTRIVETGCYRGIPDDGMSTVVWGMLAQECGGFLESIDISHQNIEASRSVSESLGVNATKYVVGDSVSVLALCARGIDMLYLDSLDYSESDPLPCQIHSLAEASAAVPKMAERSLILIDDASLPGGGKARLSRKFLQDIGWVVVAEGYQVLLANFNPSKLSKLA